MMQLLKEATDILLTGDTVRTKDDIRLILEDVNSPVTRKYSEDLYNQVIQKNHIDFDDIPVSKGDLKLYKGYSSMRSCLDIIRSIAIDHKSDLIHSIDTVGTAIDNILLLKESFKKGFTNKNEMVILEYNTYVYTCIQATTSLIYFFVDYIKRPDQSIMTGTLKNTKYRPDLFYIQQLEKFNVVNKSGNYKKYLTAMLGNGTEYFTGATIVGIATLSALALSIVPITRELIFQFYNVRRKVSDALAIQSHLIEMNKLYIEGNQNINSVKKASILKKQEKIKLEMIKLSDLLKVDNATASDKAKRELKDKNSLLNIDNIQKEISDSPLQLL